MDIQIYLYLSRRIDNAQRYFITSGSSLDEGAPYISKKGDGNKYSKIVKVLQK
jgi:hypothetical protein